MHFWTLVTIVYLIFFGLVVHFPLKQFSCGYFIADMGMIIFNYPHLGGWEFVSYPSLTCGTIFYPSIITSEIWLVCKSGDWRLQSELNKGLVYTDFYLKCICNFIQLKDVSRNWHNLLLIPSDRTSHGVNAFIGTGSAQRTCSLVLIYSSSFWVHYAFYQSSLVYFLKVSHDWFLCAF